jgi:hypothetical protein
MVDPEVELVMYPRRFDASKQRKRLVDQVVVVQEPAPVLFGFLALDDLG